MKLFNLLSTLILVFLSAISFAQCNDGDPTTYDIQDILTFECANIPIGNNTVCDVINCEEFGEGLSEFCVLTHVYSISGNCIILLLNGPTDDFDNCTTDDTCACGFLTTTPVVIGGGCDDGDPNTINDVYDASCNCAGTPGCDDGDPNTYDILLDAFCYNYSPPDGMTVCDTTACPPDLNADLGNPCTFTISYITEQLTLECTRIRLNGPLPDQDNNACTSHECQCGTVVEIGTVCDPPPNNACVETICDPATGQCIEIPVNCDDGNPATYDFCHPTFGCQHVTIPEGTSVCATTNCDNPPTDSNQFCRQEYTLPDGTCITLLLTGPTDDGNACTDLDTCNCGQFDTTITDCDDGNPCTIDTCDPILGCLYITLTPGESCDDGNPNTVNDVYDEQCNCAGEAPVPGCFDIAACNFNPNANVDDGSCLFIGNQCDDGDPCTENDTVDPLCNCVGTFIDCDDDDPCTIDFCIDGVCQHVEDLCFDGNPYTVDFCDPLTGQCTHVNAWEGAILTAPVGICQVLCKAQVFDFQGNFIDEVLFSDDDCGGVLSPSSPLQQSVYDFETDQNFAYSIVFFYAQKSCDDGDDCTYDFCHQEFGCTNVPIPCGSEVCYVNDCEDAGTQGYSQHCTVEHTLPDGTCISLILSGPVSDGDACTTNDTCNCGLFSSQPVVCNDDNPCTVDVCDSTEGCLFLQIVIGSACDDGDPNTINDIILDDGFCTCQGTEIHEGCPDPTACNYDPIATVDDFSCQFIGSPCDDGDPCTIDDVYTSECLCVGEPKDCDDGDPCTIDYCDIDGTCVHVQDDCFDNNPYTIDTCHPIFGCVHTLAWQDHFDQDPNIGCSVICSITIHDDEGNFLDSHFTGDPSCDTPTNGYMGIPFSQSVFDPQSGLYHSYTVTLEFKPRNCDDGDPCTIDDCDQETGDCTHTPIDCDDNYIYTIDSCNDGNCEHELLWDLELEAIDAESACFELCNWIVIDNTNDVFLGWYGNNAPCDGPSGSVTVDLTDENGNVVSITIDYTLKAINCDDGDPCTIDSCDDLIGCQHTPIVAGMACDDGNPCTENDVYDAECNCAGTPKDCDDGNPCSIDSCDPVTGECLHEFFECDDGNPCTLDGCDQETGACVNIPAWEFTIAELAPVPCYDLCGYIVYDPDLNVLANTSTPNGCDPDLIVTIAGQAGFIDFVNPGCPHTIFLHYVAVICDDLDPCTIDFCNDDGDCEHIAILGGEACDDGDPNTVNDVYGAPPTCACAGEAIVEGCTDPEACNYNSAANVDDGSCVGVGGSCDDGNPLTYNDIYLFDCSCEGFPFVLGCINENACNYNPQADLSDDSCKFPGDECSDGDPFTYAETYQADCSCVGLSTTLGCTDENACNYNPDAGVYDASCLFIGGPCDDGNFETTPDIVDENCNCVGTIPVEGCTDEVACNYNPNATYGEWLCIYIGTPCDDGDGSTFGDLLDEDCNCVGTPFVFGCDDPEACNFDAAVTHSSGICLFPGSTCDDGDATTTGDVYDAECNCVGTPSVEGCTVENACNYNPAATFGDYLCLFPGDDCDDGDATTFADFINDDCNCEGVPFVFGCTDPFACNYNSNATHDSGICLFSGGPCDDGDPNTTNDMYNLSCNCVGIPSTPCPADLDGNGEVNTADLLEFLGVFGTTCD